jgi:hypothetical protein
MTKFFAVLFFCVLAAVPLAAQGLPFLREAETETGDPAIAERYVLWAEKELAAGRPAQALTGLERGADYADVSADLLYLLARTRKEAGMPADTVLNPCAAAMENGRWKRYTALQCRLLAVETLVVIRRYEQALAVLDLGEEIRAPAASSSAQPGGRGFQEGRRLPESAETVRLRLLCRAGLGHDREFILLMKEALYRYPRDTRIVRILFDFCGKQRFAAAALTELTGLVLRRLPLLVEDDPEIAYMASPYIRDREEAARYVASFRAEHQSSPASLPEALSLGLVDDMRAAAELFTFRQPGGKSPARVLDRDLVLNVWKNLRSEEGRRALQRNLYGYTGVIQEDADRDGIFDAWTEYREGDILSYVCNTGQDGYPELKVRFYAGVPAEAEVLASGEDFSGKKKVLLRWERYPAVLHADFDGVRYIPRPADFFFAPLRFGELAAGGPSYPRPDEFGTVFTERGLLSFSVFTERESREFPGAVVRTLFDSGMPVSSETRRDEKLIAETDFFAGRPVLERADLDGDGRMETVRRFSQDEYGLVASSESDWDGDGVYEYAEILQSNGLVKKFWDLDGDGIRETER